MATCGTQVGQNNSDILGKERGHSQTRNIPIANADTKIFYKPSGTQVSPGEKEKRAEENLELT